jgi:hypothetical protein
VSDAASVRVQVLRPAERATVRCSASSPRTMRRLAGERDPAAARPLGARPPTGSNARRAHDRASNTANASSARCLHQTVAGVVVADVDGCLPTSIRVSAACWSRGKRSCWASTRGHHGTGMPRGDDGGLLRRSKRGTCRA